MKFVKKPVVIEATQWFEHGDHSVVEDCWFDTEGRVRWAPGDNQALNVFACFKRPAIRTLEGWHMVEPGDWIITGVKGEHYPCKPDIFELTYEKWEGEMTESKPVAWRWLDTATFRKSVPASSNPSEWTPLYTNPQKPLSDDQIDALILPPSGSGTIRDLVRIVEAAHGIGRGK